MPRLGDPRIIQGHAVSFLLGFYLKEPRFSREFRKLREDYRDALSKLVAAQVVFLANCKQKLPPQQYQDLFRSFYNPSAKEGNITKPNLQGGLAHQLEEISRMYSQLGPYFRSLEELASRWKLAAPWAGPMLYLYHIQDFLQMLGIQKNIDIQLDQLDLLYPWPPPLPPLEIKVSAWAFYFSGRKQIQSEINKRLKSYEDNLKEKGVREYPSALENHARRWFEHHVKHKTYPELERRYQGASQETIKRKVWEFSRLAGIRTR